MICNQESTLDSGATRKEHVAELYQEVAEFRVTQVNLKLGEASGSSFSKRPIATMVMMIIIEILKLILLVVNMMVAMVVIVADQ